MCDGVYDWDFIRLLSGRDEDRLTTNDVTNQAAISAILSSPSQRKSLDCFTAKAVRRDVHALFSEMFAFFANILFKNYRE